MGETKLVINLVLTLDYEIFGNGEGNVNELVVEPTWAFSKICDEFGIKATIFVEVAELLKMKEYMVFKEGLDKIESQLKHLHQNGHDIQLHIHPWWFNAQFHNGTWRMDYELSSLCLLDADRIYYYLNRCKQYLTDLLGNSNRAYKCRVYRAGYWSMMPTQNMYDALIRAEIDIDSSIYKWGVLQTELMSFDYTRAHSNLKPWFISREDVNQVDANPLNPYRLLEVPIYAEFQRGFRFINRKRIYLMNKVKSAMLENSKQKNSNYLGNKWLARFKQLINLQAKKFDFCKCSAGEMKKMIETILAQNPSEGYLPVVAIGHSKDFIFKDMLLFFRVD